MRHIRPATLLFVLLATGACTMVAGTGDEFGSTRSAPRAVAPADIARRVIDEQDGRAKA